MKPISGIIKNPSFRKSVLALTIILFSFILLTFLFRDLIVSSYLNRKIEAYNHSRHAGLKVGKIRVRWLSTLQLTGITIKPDGMDTLFRADTISVSINGWKLLAGRMVIQNVSLFNSSLTVVRRGETNNYGFLFRKEETATDTAREPLNYAHVADRLTSLIFDKIPKRISVRNLKVSVNSNEHEVACKIDRFSIEDQTFTIPLSITENNTTQQWRISGRIDHRQNFIQLMIHSPEKEKANLPFLSYKWGAFAAFDTVFISLSEKNIGDSLTNLSGKLYINGFAFRHWRISPDTVRLEKTDVSYSLNIGRDYGEIDSSTAVIINKLLINPYVRLDLRPTKKITFSIHKPFFPAQDLFSSLPGGLFTNLESLLVKGDFAYDLDFSVDLVNPDSLRFSSDLRPRQFRIVSFGGNDLGKFNGPFLYTAYEKGLPVRTFMVGPENPNYRTIDRISPYLKSAVLTSEDPSFFQHRGFIMDAFRESIIQDIKERKFARGGSTISMQLVKNVFLNRNKTISRKLEEILITWLIENQGVSSKERMFEVYLNIIEWGPLIYGANEASRFYFSKDVSKLGLAESIFLSSIIPRPKWFKYSFDENGHLRESQAGYFRLLSEKMLNRGLITQQDFDHLVPDVELKGPARLMLKKTDSIPAGTLYYPEE